MSEPRRGASRRPPALLLEILRFLVVAFFAGAGYQIGSGVNNGRHVLGALNGTAVGVVLGSGFGYVLGGVLGFLPLPVAPLLALVAVALASEDEVVVPDPDAVVGALPPVPGGCPPCAFCPPFPQAAPTSPAAMCTASTFRAVPYTHLRAHETTHDCECRLRF